MLLILTACNKNEQTIVSQPNNIPKQTRGGDYQEGDIIIGQKLEDPYTIANMQQALAILNSKGISSLNPINIRVTHKYIKFKPENEEQQALLINKTDIQLFNHPLDYEIVQLGNRYHDPSVHIDKPTPLYASVPNDYALPIGLFFQ